MPPTDAACTQFFPPLPPWHNQNQSPWAWPLALTLHKGFAFVSCTVLRLFIRVSSNQFVHSKRGDREESRKKKIGVRNLANGGGRGRRKCLEIVPTLPSPIMEVVKLIYSAPSLANSSSPPACSGCRHHLRSKRGGGGSNRRGGRRRRRRRRRAARISSPLLSFL